MIELLELYYKRYTGTVQAVDYVEWAMHHLYLDIFEVNKLAGMSLTDSLNLFEIEAMFVEAMKKWQRSAPSIEECIAFHLQSLHSQLLIPNVNAIKVVKEIYGCAIQHTCNEDQMNWQEISDVIDDFQYGDNQTGYTEELINNMITANARKLWHVKLSNLSFQPMIGKRVTAIDWEVQLIIQLEKGAVVIECPWRLRNKDGIVLGETDMKNNQMEWRSMEELLVGQVIQDVQLLTQCPLLIIQIGELFMDLFHASSLFDGWTLTDEEEFYMFSIHGGDIG